jgi:hypothetical protein
MRLSTFLLWGLIALVLLTCVESSPARSSRSRSSSSSSSRPARVPRRIFVSRPAPNIVINRPQPHPMVAHPNILVRSPVRPAPVFRTRTNTVYVPVASAPTTVTNYVDPTTGQIMEQVVETPSTSLWASLVTAFIILALVISCIVMACIMKNHR